MNDIPMPEEPEVRKPHPAARSLWLWVVAAFVALIAAWIILIIVAVDNQPEPIQPAPAAELPPAEE